MYFLSFLLLRYCNWNYLTIDHWVVTNCDQGFVFESILFSALTLYKTGSSPKLSNTTCMFSSQYDFIFPVPPVSGRFRTRARSPSNRTVALGVLRLWQLTSAVFYQSDSFHLLRYFEYLLNVIFPGCLIVFC